MKVVGEHHMTRCLLVSSLEEIASAEQGISGSALCIPFGADPSTPSRFFGSVGDISKDDFDRLLESAYPAPCGTRQVHLIESPPGFMPASEFLREET